MKKENIKGEELLGYLQKLCQELDTELRFQPKKIKTLQSKSQVTDNSETKLNKKEKA